MNGAYVTYVPFTSHNGHLRVDVSYVSDPAPMDVFTILESSNTLVRVSNASISQYWYVLQSSVIFEVEIKILLEHTDAKFNARSQNTTP